MTEQTNMGFTLATLLDAHESREVFEIARKARNGLRVDHLRVNSKERKAYRRAMSIDTVMALDKLFFERHKTAISFERPLYPVELPAEFSFVGRPGFVRVTWLSDCNRARLAWYADELS